MKHSTSPFGRAWLPAFIYQVLTALLSLGTPVIVHAASANPATKLLILKRGDILDEHSTALELSKVDFESAFALKVVLPAGQVVTVPKNQIGVTFSYPDPTAVLDSPSDVQSLNTKRTEAITLASKFPKAKPMVDLLVAQIDADVAKLNAGQVRYRGVWQARASTSPASAAGSGLVINGTTYSGVAVTKIDNGTVSISHDGGVARIPVASITPELLKLIRSKPSLIPGSVPIAELVHGDRLLKNVVLVGNDGSRLVLLHDTGVSSVGISKFPADQLAAINRTNPALSGRLAQSAETTGQPQNQTQTATRGAITSLSVTDQLNLRLATVQAPNAREASNPPSEPVPLLVRRLTAEAAILSIPVQGPGSLLERLNAVSQLNIKNHLSIYGGDLKSLQIIDSMLRVDSVSEATVAVAEAEKLGVRLPHADVLKMASAAKLSALEANKGAVAALGLFESQRLNDLEKTYVKHAISQIGGPEDAATKAWFEVLLKQKTNQSSEEWIDRRGGIADAASKINSDEGLSMLREIAKRDQFGAAEGTAQLFAQVAEATELTGDQIKSLYTSMDASTLKAVGATSGDRNAILAALQQGGVNADALGGKSVEAFAAELSSMHQKAFGGLAGAIDETKDMIGSRMGDVFASKTGLARHVEMLLEILKPSESEPSPITE